MKLQIGIHSLFDLPAAADAMEAQEIYVGETYRKMSMTMDMTGAENVEFQVESPISVALAIGGLVVPREQGAVLGRLINNAPKGSSAGLHLCWGNVGDKGRIEQLTPEIAQTVVEIIQGAADTCNLAYAKFPVATGNKPSPTEPEVYEPLRHLPKDLLLFLGVADYRQDEGEQLRIVRAVEGITRRTVGVAPTCGEGRKSLENARKTIQIQSRLANAA